MTHVPLTAIKDSAFLRDYFADATQIFPGNAIGVGAPSASYPLDDPPASPCVVTGQQVGLFGGPLYTLLKIRSAAQLAAQYSEALGKPVRTVFWLEDTDHDAAEAGTAWVPASDGTFSRITIREGAGKTPVSELTFTEDEAQLLAGYQLPGNYVPGNTWSNAFLELLQPYLEAWNVEVVRGSEVVASGVHADLVRRDVESDEFVRATTDATHTLEQRGYHVQAAVPQMLFFLLVNGERCKLKRDADAFQTIDGHRYSRADLLSILHAEPHRFSPNVLGRPLVQDVALPTIANVLGMAELHYHAQLTQAYPLIPRAQPHAILRHHACLLDARSERLLRKLDMDISQCFAPWQEVEANALRTDVAAALESLDQPEQLAKLLAPYHQAAANIDPTLEKSVLAAKASMEGALEGVKGKIKAAMKRKQSERLEQLRTLWWWVFPDGVLNERMIPLAVLEARLGRESMRSFVELVCMQDRQSLTAIGPSDLTV
jgi:bacillithiol biosynthesis cysteine-adding enzyme BshC